MWNSWFYSLCNSFQASQNKTKILFSSQTALSCNECVTACCRFRHSRWATALLNEGSPIIDLTGPMRAAKHQLWLQSGPAHWFNKCLIQCPPPTLPLPSLPSLGMHHKTVASPRICFWPIKQPNRERNSLKADACHRCRCEGCLLKAPGLTGSAKTHWAMDQTATNKIKIQ